MAQSERRRSTGVAGAVLAIALLAAAGCGRAERWEGLDASIRRSDLAGCQLSLESPLGGFLRLMITVDGEPSAVAEIYEHTLQVEESAEGVLYFSDSVNQAPERSFHATQTQAWADRRGAPLRRIQVRVCDSIRLENGVVPYHKSLPFFPCEEPVRTVRCE